MGRLRSHWGGFLTLEIKQSRYLRFPCKPPLPTNNIKTPSTLCVKNGFKSFIMGGFRIDLGMGECFNSHLISELNGLRSAGSGNSCPD